MDLSSEIYLSKPVVECKSDEAATAAAVPVQAKSEAGSEVEADVAVTAAYTNGTEHSQTYSIPAADSVAAPPLYDQNGAYNNYYGAANYTGYDAATAEYYTSQGWIYPTAQVAPNLQDSILDPSVADSRKRGYPVAAAADENGSLQDDVQTSCELETTTESGEPEKPVGRLGLSSVPGLDELWAQVSTDFTDFDSWTKLLAKSETCEEVSEVTQAYDVFLERYPLCFGYWKKYSDILKRRNHSQEDILKIFERGVCAIPQSVDLWIHFLNYIIKNVHADNTPESVEKIRELFERSIDACGLEYHSDKLWDMYVNWENSNSQFARITKLYDRLFKVPTKAHADHFTKFLNHINSHPVNEVIEEEELIEFCEQIPCEELTLNTDTNYDEKLNNTLEVKTEGIVGCEADDTSNRAQELQDELPQKQTEEELTDTKTKEVVSAHESIEYDTSVLNQEAALSGERSPRSEGKLSQGSEEEAMMIAKEENNKDMETSEKEVLIKEEESNMNSEETKAVGKNESLAMDANKDVNMDQESEDINLAPKYGLDVKNVDNGERTKVPEYFSESVSEKIRISIIERRERNYEELKSEIEKIKPFEDLIKRNYFHVKPVERIQLNAWKNYIKSLIAREKEEEKSSEEKFAFQQRILFLFERSVTTCCYYEEYWLKYISYLEEINSIMKAQQVFSRAGRIHLPRNISLHLQWAQFEEKHGFHENAVKVFSDLEIIHPEVVKIPVLKAAVYRRMGNLTKSGEAFQAAIANVKSRDHYVYLSMKLARFRAKVEFDFNAAYEVLQTALKKYPVNDKLHGCLIDLEYSGRQCVNVESFCECCDVVINNNQIPLSTRLKFSQRKLEILEDFGSNLSQILSARCEYEMLSKEQDSAANTSSGNDVSSRNRIGSDHQPPDKRSKLSKSTTATSTTQLTYNPSIDGSIPSTDTTGLTPSLTTGASVTPPSLDYPSSQYNNYYYNWSSYYGANQPQYGAQPPSQYDQHQQPPHSQYWLDPSQSGGGNNSMTPPSSSLHYPSNTTDTSSTPQSYR